MNDYCVSILDQMGYHVVNPNQQQINIIDKSTYEVLSKLGDINILFTKCNNTSKNESIELCNDGCVHVKKDGLDISMNTRNDKFATYDVIINDGINTLNILISQSISKDYSEDALVARIEVRVIDSNDRTIDSFYIDQFSSCYVIKFPHRHDLESYREIPASECNTNTIMNFINEMLNGFEEIENSKKMQIGLKYILPSLIHAVRNMLDYWKEFAIPKEIHDRENNILSLKDAIRVYEKKIRDLNSLIDSEQVAINELNEILDQGNTKKTISFNSHS